MVGDWNYCAERDCMSWWNVYGDKGMGDVVVGEIEAV